MQTESSPGSQEIPCPPPDRPPRSRVQGKTSRHTQTHRPPPETATKPSRPIRPLFPPCPWQSGSFPQGPVRHLPSFNQARCEPSGSRSNQQKKSSKSKPTTTKDRNHADPGSFSPTPPPSFSHPSADHSSPLIEELPTSSLDPSPPPAASSSTSTGPEDRNSLNF